MRQKTALDDAIVAAPTKKNKKNRQKRLAQMKSPFMLRASLDVICIAKEKHLAMAAGISLVDNSHQKARSLPHWGCDKGKPGESR
jgi:hypothetical protein